MVKPKRLQENIQGHLKSNIGLYILVLVFFAIGVAAGAFTERALDNMQKESLIKYLHGFFQILTSGEVDSGTVLWQSIKNNAQTMFAIWILGITVIGIPFILVIMGLRGCIIGFTVGFLIDNLAVKGLLFTLLAIVPQNLVIIPCILGTSVLSISFSLMIIKDKMAKRWTNSYWQKFLSYSILMILLFIISVGGILIEAYITPVFIKLMSSYMIA